MNNSFHKRIPSYLIISVMLLSFFSWRTTGAGVAEVGLFMGLLILYIHRIELDRINTSLLCLVISVVISSLFGAVWGYSFSLRTIITYSISVVFIVSALSYKYEEYDIYSIINIYIISSAIGSIAILYNVLIDHQYGYFRYSATFFGVDRDSLYLCAYQMGALYLSFNKIIKKKERRVLNVICSSIIVLGQIFTGDRAAIIISLFVFLYIIITYQLAGENKRHLFVTVFFLFVGVCIVWFFVKKYLPDYAYNRLFTIDSYKDNSSRIGMWKKCLELFAEHPIFGIGLENNNITLLGMGLHYSHNAYIDLLCAQGIVGVIIFFFFLIVLIKKSEDKVFLIGFIVSSLATLFIVNGYNTMTFWVPVLLISLLSKYNCQ